MKIPFEEKNLLGIKIHDAGRKELLSFLKNVIQTKGKLIIYGLCIGSLSRMRRKKRELPKMFESMDIIVADGGGIPVLGKLFGARVKEQIPIADFTRDLLELADNNQLKVFLFGASEESNTMAVENLRKDFPNAIIPKGINGYFKPEEESDIVDKINQENPDILLLGMTYPIKERFSVNYKDQLNANIIVPCGGAIDVFAGLTKRPKFKIKYIPVTWLWRWIQEPTRLSIKPDLYFMFFVFPVLLFKHITRIEKNPSLIKHYKIEK